MKQGGEEAAAQRSSYPYADTRAAQALSAAIDAISRKDGVSLRSLAGRLGYKSAVVVSHMRTGRLPIPVDRAVEIARAVGIEPARFLMLVLEQRYPSIDFTKALATGRAEDAATDVTPATSRLVTELEQHAGRPLDKLPAATIAVLREVVSDPRPRRRWLGVSEASVTDIVRSTRPDLARDGVSPGQANLLADFLMKLA